MSSSDNGGCLIIVAIACGSIVVIYAIISAFTSLGTEIKENPKAVMGVILIIGVIAFIIVQALKEYKKK